jgi:hypothetical protein
MGSEPMKGVRSKDPTVGLRAVAALRRLADELEQHHVRRAREQGLSWEAIGIHLQVSRQGLHKKFASAGWESRARGGQ